VLFFISLESRRIEFVACTPNPTGAWVAQQARNLVMTLDDREKPVRFLIHDRDSKFSGGCDHVFQSQEITVIRTPVQAPNAKGARRALGQQRASRVPRPAAHLQPAPARTRPAHLRRSLQPPSAASGACTSSTRAGGRKPETPPSATLPAAKPPGSARRPDPRIQTRSLRPTSLRTHDLRSSSARQLTQASTYYSVHARATIRSSGSTSNTRRPVRFGPLPIRLATRMRPLRTYQPRSAA
jgi:hypothetical protein